MEKVVNTNSRSGYLETFTLYETYFTILYVLSVVLCVLFLQLECMRGLYHVLIGKSYSAAISENCTFFESPYRMFSF